MNNDLRKSVRVSMLAPLTVRPFSGLSADDCFCRLNGQDFDDYLKRNLYKKLNISATGIAFESNMPFAPGSILEVRFTLDDIYTGVIELCIEVLRVDIWPRGYWIAGRYIGINEGVRELIFQFIAEREQRVSRKK
jgi:hypothetical protein